jgi:outer membrane immunogenic protein
MVGTGLEFGLWHNWSAKVEYDYLDLGHKNVTLTGNECFTSIALDARACDTISRTFRIDQTIHVIKFGINYRFNWGPFVGKAPVVGKGKAPVVASY